MYQVVEVIAVDVQMTLPVGQTPSTQVVGRYIGSQGPLPNTVADFWRMIWEQQVHLLLMLTAETEGRRVKCHRYWPQAGETPSHHGHLSVACTSEHKTSSATVRDLQLTNDMVSSRIIIAKLTHKCLHNAVNQKFCCLKLFPPKILACLKLLMIL